MLFQNWADYGKIDFAKIYQGHKVNDSQVAIERTIFWPDIIESLRPSNAGVRAKSLAVVGTHHWGMALPIVGKIVNIDKTSGKGLMQRNPFPREALFKAMTLTIAHDKVQETTGPKEQVK
jgi:hypothetical protein